MASSSPPFLKGVKLEFSGGCELLVHDHQQHVSVPDTLIPTGTTLHGLIAIVRDHYIAERAGHFCVAADSDGEVGKSTTSSSGPRLRPGVLALVNDCDAEVFGGPAYVLCDDDEVTFISTLHGG